MDGRSNKRLEARIWAWLKIGQGGCADHLGMIFTSFHQPFKFMAILEIVYGIGFTTRHGRKHPKPIETSGSHIGSYGCSPCQPQNAIDRCVGLLGRSIAQNWVAHHCSASFNEECEELCQSAILSAVRRIWTSKSHCLRKSLERPTKGIWVSSNMKGVPLYMVIWMGNLRF